MKIKLSNLIYCIFIIIVLINCRFFFMFYVNPLYGFLLTVLLVGIVLYFENNDHNKINSSHYLSLPFVRRLSIFTAAVFLCFLIFSKINYPKQNWMQTFSGGAINYSLLLVLLVYPITIISNQKKGVKWIFDLMNVFSSVIYVLVILQYVIYNYNGMIILPYSTNTGELLILNGTLRISLSWFGNFMIIYNFYIVYREKSKSFKSTIIHLLLFFLGLITFLFIERIRGLTWVVALCIIYIIMSGKNTTWGIGKKVFFIIICAVLLFGTGYFTSYIESISVNAERGYSTEARLYAIEYYWGIFMKKPLYGFGLADGGSAYYSLVHGNGMASPSDVGIFGMLARYGLFFVPIYVYPLIRAIIKLYMIRKSKVIKDFSLYFVFALYILLSSITYLVTCSTNLIILWPVFLVVSEYIIVSAEHNIEVLEP